MTGEGGSIIWDLRLDSARGPCRVKPRIAPGVFGRLDRIAEPANVSVNGKRKDVNHDWK
jgi:hypothetical protein